MLDITKHIKEYADLYAILLSWAIVGRFAPNMVAVVWASLSFFLVLRTGNLTKTLIAFIAMLILSDNREPMMAFAATSKIFAVLLLVGNVIRNYQEFRGLDNRIFRFFLPFLLFALVASAWAVEPFNAFQKSLSFGLIYFTVPIFFLRAFKQNGNLAKDFINFITVILVVGLLAYIVNPEFATLVGRYRGLLGNPNGMGILLTVTGPLYFLLKKSAGERFMDRPSEYLFLGVFVISLLLTGSRTSLFAILMFIGFLQLRYLSNTVTLVLFILIVVGYDFILTSLPQIASIFGLQEYLRIETLDEGSGRFVAWNFAWQQIQDVFFVGGGYGYTEIIYKRYFWELSALGHQGNAHNSYLTLWLDTGLVGIILLGASLVRTALICVKESRYALPIIYSILFSANFESWLSASLNPFTSIFLISLTLLSQPKEIDAVETASDEDDESEPEKPQLALS